MTQIPSDQLAKEFLQELLTPLGQVERSFEVPGEPKFVDGSNPRHYPSAAAQRLCPY